MDLIKLFAFLRSGIGIFLIIAVMIGMSLPDSMHYGFGMIVAIVLIIMFIALIVKVFSSFNIK